MDATSHHGQPHENCHVSHQNGAHRKSSPESNANFPVFTSGYLPNSHWISRQTSDFRTGLEKRPNRNVVSFPKNPSLPATRAWQNSTNPWLHTGYSQSDCTDSKLARGLHSPVSRTGVRGNVAGLPTGPPEKRASIPLCVTSPLPPPGRLDSRIRPARSHPGV